MHLYMMVEATPETHKELIDKVNRRKYKMPNQYREGYCVPHISEIKFYDVRIKKEVAPEFLRDFGGSVLNSSENQSLWKAWKNNQTQSEDVSLTGGRLIGMAKWAISKLGSYVRLKPLPKKAEGKKEPFIQGWYYPFHLGMSEDMDRGMGEEL